MKLYKKKDIEKIIKTAKLDVFKNISKDIPKRANALDKIIAEQLDRLSKTIQDWRSAVDAAEDIINPDRQELIEMYRDFIDDYQLWGVMQSRINKSISGSFKIIDETGDIDEEEQKKFIDPQGFPLTWFRDFMRYIIESKFYGWEAIQLGDAVDDRFSYVEKIPEENQIPYYDSMIKNSNMTFTKGDTNNAIYFGDEPVNTWVIRYGSETDLGLINKCAPYIIWKQVFGSWSQHASLFGMPFRVGKTDLSDNRRKQNFIDAFEAATGADYIITDLLDEFETIEQKGGGDPHNIYGQLIEKCDQAISKIVLSQTGTTDEKSYSGSASVHANTEADLIFSDKLDIKSVVNEMLIPRMKKIGMISESKKIFGGWDFAEKLTVDEWATVIQKISQSGFAVDPEDVEKRTSVKVDSTVVPMPENKTFSIMNMYDKFIKNDKDNS